jgi:hypothetical protein
LGGLAQALRHRGQAAEHHARGGHAVHELDELLPSHAQEVLHLVALRVVKLELHHHPVERHRQDDEIGERAEGPLEEALDLLVGQGLGLVLRLGGRVLGPEFLQVDRVLLRGEHRQHVAVELRVDFVRALPKRVDLRANLLDLLKQLRPVDRGIRRRGGGATALTRTRS